MMKSRRSFVSIVFAFLLMFCGCDNSPGIIKGDDLFEKSPFYQSQTPVTPTTHIALLDSDSDSATKIGIFNQFGMHIVDGERRTLIKKVKFDWSPGITRPEVVDLRDDGSFKIMVRGGGYTDVGLMNDEGKVLWRDWLAPYDMAAGDVDGNGVLEFYTSDSKGLQKVNFNGKKVWRVNYPLLYNVMVYESGKDEDASIVTCSHKYRFQFWNVKGELLRDIQPAVKDASDIMPCQWPSPGHILARGHRAIYVLDSDGKVILKHSLWRSIYKIRGTSVRFSEKEEPYLAVLAGYSSTTGLSMLCIFSPEGRLVYKELLEGTTGLLAFQPKDSKSEVLLVSCRRGACEYRLKVKE